MKVRARAPVAALCLSLVSPAPARADCEWAEDLFHLRGTSGAVRALVVFDDGSGEALYAAGDFTAAGDAPADRVARWDGSTWRALGAGINGARFATAGGTS